MAQYIWVRFSVIIHHLGSSMVRTNASYALNKGSIPFLGIYDPQHILDIYSLMENIFYLYIIYILYSILFINNI